jgi:hypothetical protein
VHINSIDFALTQAANPVILSAMGNTSGSSKVKYKPADKRYEKMKYNRCGQSGLLLPAVSLGLWHNFGDVDDFETGRGESMPGNTIGVVL